MLKTMWNMPAALLRTSTSDDGTACGDEQLASGSLEQMIGAFDAQEGTDVDAIVIKCAGRDRPITAQEIRDLRRDRVTTKAA
ncbi:hypothetical protein IFR23_02915 [Sphingomonas sp. CFBP 13603]|uniref:hypothetical protein n=1 Tax=Sphingomonas sp. CFBP 13603 TaxID=2774040 RepID=UPI001866987C|nr:hypothetical protein [Sphingomonas sp. CFBP 13603]MBE2990959.1 hypothetical protein [Sphingomonas sp. CFBP 13603]